jgi:hypothetical protein
VPASLLTFGQSRFCRNVLEEKKIEKTGDPFLPSSMCIQLYVLERVQ